MDTTTNKINDTIIRTPSDLTLDWLRAKTGISKIESFSCTRIGTGQVSDCFRISFALAPSAASTPDAQQDQPPVDNNDNTAPLTTPTAKTTILKVASTSATSRRASASLSLYEREVRFYQEIAPAIIDDDGDAAPLAHCYHSSFHAADGTFCLLLEDAGAQGVVVGDDITGATLAQAQAAMAALGRLHRAAQRDGSRRAEWASKSWLNRGRQIDRSRLRALYGGFVARFGERVGSRERNACERLVEVFDLHDARERGDDVLQGLVHGDYRLDNMLFGKAGGGGEEARGDAVQSLPLTVVDWQTVSWGPAMSDVAYFLGTALTVEMRRQHGDALLQRYFEALGPEAGLSFEQCRERVRRQTFYGIVMSIVSPMLVEQTERGDELFMQILSRHCEHVLDLGALETLPQPTSGMLAAPLVPEPRDERRHETLQEEYWQESWYFDFIDEVQGLGGYIRIGVDTNRGKTWYTAMLCGPGRPTVALIDFNAPLPTGDDLAIKTPTFEASHAVEEPLQRFSVTLSGTARAYDDPAILLRDNDGEGKHEPGKPVQLQLHLAWHTDGLPYQYRLTTRYEIPCSVSGDISVVSSTSSTTTQISNVPGQRDHSWGSRDWWTPRWVWSAIHLADRTHIHGLDLHLPDPQPAGMRLFVGYVQQLQRQSQSDDSEETGEAEGASGAKVTELTRHAVAATSFDPRDELPVTTEVELELELERPQEQEQETGAGTDPLRLRFEAMGHAPLRLIDPVSLSASSNNSTSNSTSINDDGSARSNGSVGKRGGRVALFPRAWGTVAMKDGRRGVAWMEWNRGAGGESAL